MFILGGKQAPMNPMLQKCLEEKADMLKASGKGLPLRPSQERSLLLYGVAIKRRLRRHPPPQSKRKANELAAMTLKKQNETPVTPTSASTGWVPSLRDDKGNPSSSTPWYFVTISCVLKSIELWSFRRNITPVWL